MRSPLIVLVSYMTFTDWQIGRIRSRLITYYFHNKYDVTVRSARRAKIEARLNKLKTSEQLDNKGYNKDVINRRDSFSWTDIAFKIIASEYTNLEFPSDIDSDAASGVGEVDDDWPINNLQLQRFYDGLNRPETKDSRGNKFRALQVPPQSSLKAIYQFLKKDVHYLVDDDLVEPNFWLEPDTNLMFEIGADYDELRKSMFPLLVSRDYISHSTLKDELKYGLLSIDTKYSYKPARIRYITHDNFHNETNSKAINSFKPHWSWYWGWMVYPNQQYSVMKVQRDRSFNKNAFAFLAFEFIDDGEHISSFSLTRRVTFSGDNSDKYIVDAMAEFYSTTLKKQRKFKRYTEINLTNIVRNYRFDIDDDQRPAVLGYKDTPEGENENEEHEGKSRSLVEELFSKIRNKLLFSGREKGMVKGKIPVEGKYFSDDLIFHDENHVMNLSLKEVVKQARLGERLVETMDHGYPWHVAELIELGCEPNYVTPDDNACALHFIASNSANAHLVEFTKAVAASGETLTFNVKTRQGQLPSGVAADHCVDPDMTEYFFKMEALERQGKKTSPYEIPEVYRGPIFEGLVP